MPRSTSLRPVDGRLLRFWIWALLAVGLLAVFARSTLPALRVQTDLLAMLPADARDPSLDEALAAYGDALSRDSLFLVGAEAFATARDAAEAFADRLADSGAVDTVQLTLGETRRAAAAAYLPYRAGLLDDATRRSLMTAQDGDASLLRRARASLLAPTALASPYAFIDDPLGLLAAFHRASMPSAGRATLRDGVLSVSAQGRHYVLVRVRGHAGAFSIAAQQAIGDALAQARQAALAAGAESVYGSGVVLHASAAAARAKREMTLFGGISAVSVLLLLIVVFRSPRPLLLAVTTIALGALAGLVVSQAVFGEIFVVSLVFGTSLIGISVDYALHWFADGLFSADDARARLRRVAAPVLLGCASTLAAFAGLMLAPFPGLRQLALFSASGLAVSCATVLCAYPLLAGGRSGRSPRRWVWLDRLAAAGGVGPRWRRALGAGLLLVIGGGLLRLEFVDDVRSLQSSPADLLAQEAAVRDLLGQRADRRMLVLRAPDPQALLQAEEALHAPLDELVADGALGGWHAVSSALPSLQRQQHDRALLDAVVADGGALPRLLAELGMAPADIRAQQRIWRSDARLTPDALLATPAGELVERLWLGRVGDHWASVVVLFDVRDAAAVQRLAQAHPAVRWVDRLADVSALLAHYRRLAIGLIGVVYVALGVLLALRYGPRAGALTLLPATAGGLVALAVLGLLGIPANLFAVLALLLVLGMGVDYAIFLREARDGAQPALLAVGLSALTTLLAFGMLAFSSTPFIHMIGLPVGIGIVVVVVLALLLRPSASVPNRTPS